MKINDIKDVTIGPGGMCVQGNKSCK